MSGLYFVRFVLETINITTLVEAGDEEEAKRWAQHKVEEELGTNLQDILETEVILEGAFNS